jgi:hypothetical protein
MDIMKLLVIIVLHAIANTAAADDYIYLEIGLGNNTNITGASIEWDDAGATGAWLSLGYREEYGNWYSAVHWTHVSQYEAGPPWNDDDESSLDHFGVKFGYMWK